MSRNNLNKVFFAESYHPIQAGSIDGTDILTHDNAVFRALLCSSAGLCMRSSSLFSDREDFLHFSPPGSCSIVSFLFFSLLFFLVCSVLDDPFGDPNVIGDPYRTLFVGRLSHFTTEETLREVSEFMGSKCYEEL